MTKAELIAVVSEKTQLTKKDSDKAVAAVPHLPAWTYADPSAACAQGCLPPEKS